MFCRRDELLPTLRYVLPWLKAWGYDIVSLGEAAAAAAAGQSELTFDTLAAHTLGVQGYFAHTKQHSQHQAGGSGSAQQYGNSSCADLQGLDAELDASLRSASERASPGGGGLVGWKASAGSLRQLEGVTDNADKLRMSAAYMAQMAKVSSECGRWRAVLGVVLSASCHCSPSEAAWQMMCSSSCRQEGYAAFQAMAPAAAITPPASLSATCCAASHCCAPKTHPALHITITILHHDIAGARACRDHRSSRGG